MTIKSYSQGEKDSIIIAKKVDSTLILKKQDSLALAVLYAKKQDSLNMVTYKKKRDSINKVGIERNIKDKPRFGKYKLYPTNNVYNFLKLDTSTGKLWQVQWSVEDNKRFDTFLGDDAYYFILKDEGITSSWDDYERPVGRFELYSTTNMYNFILLDKFRGYTWQVQWSFERNNRLIMIID
jgi:hypothetical protein